MAADGAAAVEILRAELARAKEQARFSNAAAEKASAELKAEQAARHQDEEKISTIALELKNATSRYEFLEKENKAKMADLDKALREVKEARSESRAAREEIRQAGEIAVGKPFYYRLSLAIQIMLSLTKCGALQTRFWTCQRVHLMWCSFTKRKKVMQRRSFSGRSSVRQNTHCC